jgi:hypothetical protein
MWDDTTTAQLLAVRGTMSTSAIARQLSTLLGRPFSKGQIIGKLNRIAAKSGVKPITKPAPKPKAKPQPVTISPARRTAPAPQDWLRGWWKIPKRKTFIDPLGCEQVDPERPPQVIWELTEGACRWPIQETKGITGRHLFCAAPTKYGAPYCAGHMSRAWRPADEETTCHQPICRPSERSAGSPTSSACSPEPTERALPPALQG